MRKIIIFTIIGTILLLPLILPEGFAAESENTDRIFQIEEVEDHSIIIAFVISGIGIVAIVSVFRYLSRKPLIEIIWNSQGMPTLSKFQFLLWTCIIAFSYLAIQIIVIAGTDYSGEYLLNNIPENLLALMGISVSVPIANAFIKEPKKDESNGKFFGIMFYNPEGNLDLARLQMFIWTIIGIAIFLYVLFDQLFTITTTNSLFLPDVSPTLLILMGLSQTAYLGSKVNKKIQKKTD